MSCHKQGGYSSSYGRERDAVDYEHHVVAHQQGGDEHVLVAREHVDDTVYDAAARGVYLHADLAGLHEGYLRAREQPGEHDGDQRDDNGETERERSEERRVGKGV